MHGGLRCRRDSDTLVRHGRYSQKGRTTLVACIQGTVHPTLRGLLCSLKVDMAGVMSVRTHACIPNRDRPAPPHRSTGLPGVPSSQLRVMLVEVTLATTTLVGAPGTVGVLTMAGGEHTWPTSLAATTKQL